MYDSAHIRKTIIHMEENMPKNNQRQSDITLAASDSRSITITILCIAAASFILRFILAYAVRGHAMDMSCFTSWAYDLSHAGLSNFYHVDGYFADYPPLYMLVLYFIGHIAEFLKIRFDEPGYALLLKLPAILCDAGIALLLFNEAKKRLSKVAAVSLAAAFAVSPAVILNSAIWGQIDSVFTIAIALSLVMLVNKRMVEAAIVFTLACLIKPQGFIFTPLYIYAFVDYSTKVGKASIKAWALSIASAAAIVIAVALPFSKGFDLTWLIDKYAATLGSYPYVSVNAFNLHTLFGKNWASLSDVAFIFDYNVWGFLFILLAVALSAYFYIKSKDESKLFYCGYVIIATMYTIGTKMHERYLYPALALLLLAYIYNKNRGLLLLFVTQSLVHFANVAYVFVRKAEDVTLPDFAAPVMVLSFLQVAVYAYGLYLGYRVYVKGEASAPQKPIAKSTNGKAKTKAKATQIPLPQLAQHDEQFSSKDIAIVVAITAIYAIVSFINLGGTVAPQTYAAIPKQGAVFTFDKTENVAKIMIYYGPSVQFGELTFTADTGAEYKTKHGSVLQWSEFQPLLYGNQITLTNESATDLIFEITFFDNDGKMIAAKSSVPQLCDEGDTVPEMPSYMTGSYFDEIYHPRTAFEFMEKLPPYEITHPPLGKVIMTVGYMLFGYTPLGWRFMGNLAGIAMLPMIYAMAFSLFRQRRFAVIACLLLSFDFMHFAQTRMATVDSFAVLFIMASYYFMWLYFSKPFGEHKWDGVKYLALSGLFYGIGIATKWIVLYSTIGLVAMLVYTWARGYVEAKDKGEYYARLIRTIGYCSAFFVIIPAVIYVCSYIPMVSYDLHGRTVLEYIWGNQTYMLNYHKGVMDAHPYASPWYSWLFNVRPLWAYINGQLHDQGVVSSISSFGNPLVWWAGIVAVVTAAVLAIKHKGNRATMFIVIGYVSQILPWILVPRTVFIYHYFACVPFLVLALGFSAQYLCDRHEGKRTLYIVYGFTAACGVLFVMFYPVISGLEVPIGYVKSVLTWLPSWVFAF